MYTALLDLLYRYLYIRLQLYDIAYIHVYDLQYMYAVYDDIYI